MLIGIDLGTTNSAVAYLSEEGPRLIPNALGERLTPSVVGFDSDGHLLVGSEAREYQVLHPRRSASLFKRHMGSDWTFELDGKTYTPEELSSLILRSLKRDAEIYFEEPISGAVVTVPAYFNDDQRKATIRAGELAGLKVARIINEPTAAAIAYGLHDTDDEKTVVVFDLGGGTFDVSVVDLFEGMIEVRASSGISSLGGEDFTRSLAAHSLATHGILFEKTEVESPHLIARMVQQCERAKCRLSCEDNVEIRIPNEEGDLVESGAAVEVSLEQFEHWTEGLLAQIEMPLRRSLGDIRLSPSLVDEVILVGGATRMRAVRSRVERFFGKAPRSRLNPDEVVAMGAAVQAGLIARQASLEDIVVTDVAPFTLGVEVVKMMGIEHRPGYFNPIIHRNTTIPVSRVTRHGTVRANQTSMDISIYQGENRRVAENHLLGKLNVDDIPPGPPGQEVDIRMTYDLNGVLEVEATVVATGKQVRTVITRHAHELSDAEVADAVEAMRALKEHPRDEVGNRFLLRKAERLYRELPFLERDALAQLLDGFEQVLEMREPAAIEAARRHLEEFLERFEPDAEPPDF